jgi:hypothetical protein
MKQEDVHNLYVLFDIHLDTGNATPQRSGPTGTGYLGLGIYGVSLHRGQHGVFGIKHAGYPDSPMS